MTRKLFLLLLVAAPLMAADDENSSPADPLLSLAKVNSTNQAWDVRQPWTKKPPFSRKGIGVLVEGGKFLVTADLVANSTYVEIEKPSSPDKTPATVERVDYDSNLAVVKPTDTAFTVGMKPILLAPPVRPGDSLSLLQFEPNGQLAETEARLTTITVSGYPFENVGLLLFKASLPLQQRDWSFTIPALRGGKLLGLVMRYNPKTQTAEIIPPPVIRHFLGEPTQAKPKGFARLGVGASALRDTQLRKYISLTENGGVYVTEVVPSSPAAKAGIKQGDVILAVDGNPVDRDGNYADPDFGRISFSHIVSVKKQPGDSIPLTIFRNGQKKEIPVTLETADRSSVVSEAHLSDKAPGFLIHGGLVFLELSRPYLMEWGNNWASAAPQRLVYYDAFQNELPEDRGKIVILSSILPSQDSVGYGNLQNLVVTKANNNPIKSLKELSKALQHPVEGFQKIEFEENPKALFLDAASVEKNAEAFKKHYSIPTLERL